MRRARSESPGPKHKRNSREGSHAPTLPKSLTGIAGLDEITEGGFPRGRPTLLCGSAGCGKTLLAMQFLIAGATQFDEPGVFMAFEESVEDLTENVRSLGVDLERLAKQGKVVVDYVHVDRSEIQETGEYDLEGLFIRLGLAIDSIGAKRVVLDTLESLFGGLDNLAILRAELRRLFRWLKDRGITAVITAERGDSTLTRQGLEEYVSDCVILLDHRVTEQRSTRRLRIVKYRGTTHGTNEYPFLISGTGFTVMPITSMGLTHAASSERIPTGVALLDDMLGGDGYYRGSSILVSGTAGSGKTSIAAQFVDATCRRGEPCLYFAFEESQQQMVRNMRSIGINLEPWLRKGLLSIHASRPTLHGLEAHLVAMHEQVARYKPELVIVDPLSNMLSAGTMPDVQAMLMRIIDFLKAEGITAMFTSLTSGGDAAEYTQAGISSLMDTWLLMRVVEHDGERNRGLYVLKSRGMAHSNQIRRFVLTDHGFELDVDTRAKELVTGDPRAAAAGRKQTSRVPRGKGHGKA